MAIAVAPEVSLIVTVAPPSALVSKEPPSVPATRVVSVALIVIPPALSPLKAILLPACNAN